MGGVLGKRHRGISDGVWEKLGIEYVLLLGQLDCLL